MPRRAVGVVGTLGALGVVGVLGAAPTYFILEAKDKDGEDRLLKYIVLIISKILRERYYFQPSSKVMK